MKSCNSCGKCCIKYGDGGLAASEQDMELWALFRPHIDRLVKKGEIWFDPETGTQLKQCPWLRKHPKLEQYSCDIYLDRPEDCRHYPSTVDEMIRDGCEMIELRDLDKLDQAQRALDRIMQDSRPGLA